MKVAAAKSRTAWQPLTPPGVAAFAAAPFSRLLLMEAVFALLAAMATATFLGSAWFPTVRDAIARLPEKAEVRGARLEWGGSSPMLLASSEWLALTVDLKHTGTYRIPSDIQVELSEDSIRILSFAGFLELPYPAGWIIALNQQEMGPWWKAREPFLLAAAAVGCAVGLLLIWGLLALLYAVPTALICRFVGNTHSFASVWRLCSAAQMPGCLLLSVVSVFYSLRAVDAVQWVFAFGAHFAVAWIYLFLGVFFLSPGTAGPRKRQNPFGRK